MSRRTILGMMLLVVTCLGAYTAAALGPGAAPTPAANTVAPTKAVAAAGKVEPISEEIDVGSDLTGKLERVDVAEGDSVRAGAVVAVVANREYLSQVAAARATLEDRIAALRRVVNGARVEERLETRAAVDAAEAVLAQAAAARDRRRILLDQRAVSREEVDRADEAWAVAAANLRAASERHALVDAAPREEDRARAEAAVAIARAAVGEAEVLLAKTYIRSPIDGVVLRRHHHPGETVLNTVADPIVTVGDISRLRVRAEVDELDVAALRPGLRAAVRADAYPDRTFAGVVTSVGEMLGKKRIRTELPAERTDTNVLEVLVTLDDATGLKPGLRVDVFFNRASPGDVE
jgi:multidrug resistance efflux pump